MRNKIYKCIAYFPLSTFGQTLTFVVEIRSNLARAYDSCTTNAYRSRFFLSTTLKVLFKMGCPAGCPVMIKKF